MIPFPFQSGQYGRAFVDDYPLDAYRTGIWGMYSLSKRLSAYSGPSIRVRRSSDNAESDIGFVGRVLDTASLASFIGANSATVTTFYDQTNQGHHFVQATATKQPRIVNAGVYDGFVRFDGTDDCLQSNTNSGTPAAMTAFMRGALRSTSGTQVYLELNTDGVVTAGVLIYFATGVGGLNVATGPLATRAISQFSGASLNNNVHCYRLDRAATGGANEAVFFLNGAKQTRTTSDDSGTVIGNMTAALWNVGARNNGASLATQLNLDTFSLYEAAPGDADCTAISALI